MITSIKRLAAYQRHGNLTPTWFSCDRPHCLRRLHDRKSLITLGLWLDGSIIVPITGHRPTGSCPVVIAGWYRSLAVKTNRSLRDVSLRCSSPADHGAAAMVAHAHHKSNGKVSDGWVFGCQRSDPVPENRNRWRFSVSPPVS